MRTLYCRYCGCSVLIGRLHQCAHMRRYTISPKVAGVDDGHFHAGSISKTPKEETSTAKTTDVLAKHFEREPLPHLEITQDMNTGTLEVVLGSLVSEKTEFNQESVLKRMHELDYLAGDTKEHIHFESALTYKIDPRVQAQYREHVDTCEYCQRLLESVSKTA